MGHLGRRPLLALFSAALLMGAAAPTDFDALWNYDDPRGTEAAFRAARPSVEAEGNAGRLLELDTQIARAQGLQRHFSAAFATLDQVRASLTPTETRANIRFDLELGRALRSSGQPNAARPHFEQAWTLASEEHEDALAIDALHMMALVAPDPQQQLALNQEAVAFAENSQDPKAVHWQGSLWNNIGMVYHGLGDLPSAMDAFQKALALRQQEGDRALILSARWMVAWTLRLQGALEPALAEQEALELAHSTDGTNDGYVLEELGEIHLALAHMMPGASHDRRARAYFARAYRALKDDPELADEPARIERMRRLAEGAAS